MTRLRKKLQSIGVVDLIETKKNVGYKGVLIMLKALLNRY